MIRTTSEDGISERVTDIFRNLSDVISELKPEVLVLEKLYSNYKHPVTALLMGHARGIVCLACGLNGVRLVNYPSTRIKKAVTGNGRASKQQVQRTVKALLKLKKLPEPVDISDALAMAVSYVYIEGVDKAFAIQAGREIRVMVKPDNIDDDESLVLARNIAKKIEEDLSYPGQIKVNVIRETRAVDYAK